MPPARVNENDSAKEEPTWDNVRSAVGFFDAELIDHMPSAHKSRKMVPVGKNIAKNYDKPFELPEQGSWHYDRRKAILAAHPEIAKLSGADPRTALLMVILAAFHVTVAITISTWPWYIWVPILYTLGALNSFEIAILGHEGAHGLIFPNRSVLNKYFCVFAFLFVFPSPFGSFWLVEHMWHHNVVVDKITRLGDPRNSIPRKLFTAFTATFVGQFMFMLISAALMVKIAIHHVKFVLGKERTAMPTEFGIRPYSYFPQIINVWTILNCAGTVILNYFLISNYGIWPSAYLYLASCIANGLHPLGMRMVQEHYLIEKDQPTYSVYTPWHWLCINIGHHVEHHDFATVPWTRLPQITRIAPEFYNNLKSYPDYTTVMKTFFFDEGVDPQIMFSENPMEGR